MTHIYRCELELHDSLYFATREIGRLYETEAIVHNYALCYALGLVDSDRYGTQVSEEHEYRYFCREQVPMYEEHLSKLNDVGIYVTPARSLHHTSVLHTWKYANNNYHVEMEKTKTNIPSFGRAKEIAPESAFEFFILSQNPLPKLSKWIRLGKWMSKAELQVKELDKVKQGNGDFIFPYPLNPLDVMFTHQVLSYDTVNMPPVSLIRNVSINGHFYEVDGFKIPALMAYRFKV
ncbi:CRISPR-associated protein Csc1 [Pseudanabaena sp. lw0831]|uniref:type I-D CRISPR-associated protein Cas5/Csc1 n=1 Tax=Pseudanabaena sp. lw0831 TaxID=1357935 RepID=UPI0019153A00|nr:type I-D CRISPR-associated protein Cas5/Csc1 [Pseudanabaena sp. lw0831]GBO55261.1 CRISPR-associated protein Csc1 [Pseudanabaena sp. lw0831]